MQQLLACMGVIRSTRKIWQHKQLQQRVSGAGAADAARENIASLDLRATRMYAHGIYL